MSISTGLPTPSQILLYDSWAALLKRYWSILGVNAPGETGTLAVYAATANTDLMGDGVSNYGLGNPVQQAALKSPLQSLMKAFRADFDTAASFRSAVNTLDGWVSKNLPTTWNFAMSATQAHPFDMWLTRLNACSPNTPATPASAGVLTASNNPGSNQGGLPLAASGSAPYVRHSLVSTAGDQYESLPSAEATRVAITGSENGYTYAISGVVPSGVGKVRMWRGLFGGSSATEFWLGDVSVTAGQPFSNFPIYILQPDSYLRQDISPASWLQLLATPEFAAICALCWGTTNPATGILTFNANGILSPWNVALPGYVASPLVKFEGVGNPVGSSLLGTYLIGTGWTAGAFPTANSAATNVQGYLGAGPGAAATTNGIQFRVTSPLNAAGTVQFSYTAYEASAGYGAPSTISGQSSGTFGGTADGSIANFSVPSGYVVASVTVTGVTGMTSGSFVCEALPTRNY